MYIIVLDAMCCTIANFENVSMQVKKSFVVNMYDFSYFIFYFIFYIFNFIHLFLRVTIVLCFVTSLAVCTTSFTKRVIFGKNSPVVSDLRFLKLPYALC